jgi:hypothetical protein
MISSFPRTFKSVRMVIGNDEFVRMREKSVVDCFDSLKLNGNCTYHLL